MQQSIVKFIALSCRYCSTCSGHSDVGLLMMGIIMPETFWAVSVRQSSKFYDWLLHLVGCFYLRNDMNIYCFSLILRCAESNRDNPSCFVIIKSSGSGIILLYIPVVVPATNLFEWGILYTSVMLFCLHCTLYSTGIQPAATFINSIYTVKISQ
jgi:hypothetical protein